MRLFYALLGAGVALLVKFSLERAQAKQGAAPRRRPADHPDPSSAEDEIAGPLSEV